MRLGPDKVIVCPECKAPARVFSLMSGNTIGSQRWTDGKIIAPMLPIPPAITRCRACETFFWIDHAEVVGDLHPQAPTILEQAEERPEALTDWEKRYLAELEKEGKSRLSAWLAAEQVRYLSEAEYLRALVQGLASDQKQEIYLRVEAWWAGNDLLRDISPEAQPPFERSSEATESLIRLSQLLSKHQIKDLIMKSEIARELSYFNEALALLEIDVPTQYQDIAALIRSLAQAGDALVRQIPE